MVEPGQLAIITSNLGDDLPSGQFLVDGDLGETKSKGILRRTFGPGRYRINPYGYEAGIVKTEQDDVGNWQIKYSGWVHINPGYVGVVTYLTDNPASKQKAGIQSDTLPPGLYPINPREMQIDMVSIGYNDEEISTEKKKDEAGQIVFDESGEEQPVPDTGISFPSSDGFKIHMDFSAVWGIMPDQAPDIIRRFGNIDAVEQKVIIPQCESICRNNGSKLGAVELLVGDSRQKFQADVDAAFNKILKEKNISLLYGLVRHIYIPKEVREPIQKGYVADELTLPAPRKPPRPRWKPTCARPSKGAPGSGQDHRGHQETGGRNQADGRKRSRNHRRRDRKEGRRHRQAVRRDRRPEDRRPGRGRKRRQEDAAGSQGPVVRVGRQGLRRSHGLYPSGSSPRACRKTST